MAFLVCENGDATSMRTKSERIWSSICRRVDTDLHRYKITSISPEREKYMNSFVVLQLQ